MYNELTLESCHAVGAIYEIRGDYEDAERNFREALIYSHTANWCDEGIARTKFHLANVVRKRGKSEQEADKLLREARAVLERMLPLDRPGWLYSETDEATLFDHLRSYVPRFTGTGLLRRFQTHFNPDTHSLSPVKVDRWI